MITVKILCGCGQKYAFDVEPYNGRMPATVQCPICKADGTAAANEILARTLPPAPVAAPAPVASLQPDRRRRLPPAYGSTSRHQLPTRQPNRPGTEMANILPCSIGESFS